jgi:hypothetical protein
MIKSQSRFVQECADMTRNNFVVGVLAFTFLCVSSRDSPGAEAAGQRPGDLSF